MFARRLVAAFAASLIAASALALRPPLTAAAFPGQNGLIAWEQGDMAGSQIWSMTRFAGQQHALTSLGNNYTPSFSPDGTKIVFSSNRDGNAELYVMNADGSAETRVTNTPGVSEFMAAWSPSGTQIVYAAYGSTDYDIWIANANGTGAVNLTNHAADDLYPTWQPGGSKIAFVSERDGQREIYVVNSDGSMLTNLTNSAAPEESPDWSPDGTKLAFARYGRIYRMNANGTSVIPLTSGLTDSMPAWSPDGARIAFVSLRDENAEIYVMDADGTDQARMTNNAPPGNSFPEDFSPDWQRVAVATPTCDMMMGLPNELDVDTNLTVEVWQDFGVLGHDFPPSQPLQIDFTYSGLQPETYETSSDASGELLEFFYFDPTGQGDWTVDLFAPIDRGGCSDTGSLHVVPPVGPVSRIYGADRFATAALLSNRRTPSPGTGVNAVFVANGFNFPDALAGVPAAAKRNAAILLVTPTSIPSVTKTELARLKPATIYVLGGTGAVSSTVASQLASYARSSVVRLAGANRYATAGAIVANAFPSANEVIVATGANFPDALAAGAAGASAGIPILLVTGTSVPSSTATQLTRLTPDKIWIVGGTGVVSTGVETALHAWAPTERLAGPNRYATAVATSEAFFDTTNSDHIFVSTGLNFPDALGAGVFGDPVLLTSPGSLPPDPAWEVVRLQPSSVHVLGGPAVISNTVVDQLKARC